MTTEIIVAQRMWQRRDYKSVWAAKNPVLEAGEWGVEIDDADHSKLRMKMGDGVTNWNSLAYSTFGKISSALPANGDVLIYNSAAGMWVPGAAGGGGGGGTSPRNVAQFYDECHLASVVTAGWVADSSGGSLLVQQSVSDMVGAYVARCGSLTGQRGSATAPGFKVTPGNGEIRCRFRVRPEHVPSAAGQFQYTVGLVDNLTTGSSYRILITATDGLSGWCLQYSNPSGNLTSPVVLPVVAGVTANFDLVINAAGDSVSFVADEVLIDTIALPYSFAPMHPMFISRKNGANGGQSALWIDTVLVEQDR